MSDRLHYPLSRIQVEYGVNFGREVKRADIVVMDKDRPNTVTNPLMIAEVLSKSTKSYDRDENFSAYRTIPTFQEYLLVDQYTAHVEQYSKTDSHKWIFTEYDEPESTILLSSIPFEIRLADIYESVEFESSCKLLKQE